MSFREDEGIAGGIGRLLRIIAHNREEQDRENLGRRSATGRMPTACRSRGAHGMQSQTHRLILEKSESALGLNHC